jgi:hypothetical protein
VVVARFGRTCAASTALASALVLAGCGEDEPDAGRRTVVDTPSDTADPARSETPKEDVDGEEPEAAYAAWITALAEQDAEAACALQAPEFTIDLRYEAILVDRAELGDPCVGFEEILWEDPEFRTDLVDVSATQVTEEDALLEVAFGPGDETHLTVRMVYHRAKWRVSSTADRTDTDGGISDEESGPARWVAAWCSLSPDLSRAEIVTLMGEPSGEYTVADGGEPQLWWAQDQYDFRVYLDVDGSVLELVGDYDALGKDDRALLPCPELRS